jgi:hypothetical protein
MSLADVAEQSLKGGDPWKRWLTQVQVRARPPIQTRIFLFQLLCVLGQWDRALNQRTSLRASTGGAGDGQDLRRCVRCGRSAATYSKARNRHASSSRTEAGAPHRAAARGGGGERERP